MSNDRGGPRPAPSPSVASSVGHKPFEEGRLVSSHIGEHVLVRAQHGRLHRPRFSGSRGSRDRRGLVDEARSPRAKVAAEPPPCVSITE